MKAIISHDVDHITVSEHLFRDLIIPKFIVRMKIELLSGKITFNEYILRWGEIFKNKWQNIDELITFNNTNQVPNSFFIGVNKGKGLNYSNEAAYLWIEQMKLRNCEIGNHGINYKKLIDVVTEKHKFSKLSSISNAGVRLHYLRKSHETLKYLNQSGYVYDSSVHEFKNPYKIGQMWEFPIQIMDGWVIQKDSRWQSTDLKKAKQESINLIENAHKHKLDYISLVFHDRYFSNGFKTWLDWYIWIIEYLKENKIEFLNFTTAIELLNKNNK